MWGKLGLPSHKDDTFPSSPASTDVLSSASLELGAGPVRPASAKTKLCFFTYFAIVRENGHWLHQATVVSVDCVCGWTPGILDS